MPKFTERDFKALCPNAKYYRTFYAGKGTKFIRVFEDYALLVLLIGVPLYLGHMLISMIFG